MAKVKDELTLAKVNDDYVILRGNRLVLPATLQHRIVNLAHQGHQGIVKTKQLLREKVWFAGIDKLVENVCKNCIPCLAATPTGTNQEPLNMTKLPDAPWTQVSVDFCGPFASGDYLLVVIDDYSRYPEVETVKSTSMRTVMPKLDKIFATHGIPDVVKTDNGPPFNGLEFRKFAEYLGFKHRKVTPLWPQANGEAERFMRTIGKSIRATKAEGKCWKQELYAFLRNYRATPHSTTKVPPAQALFGRNIKTKLPEITAKTKDPIRAQDNIRKQQMKNYADKHRKVKKSKSEERGHCSSQTRTRSQT